ncbi:MAG: GH36-type glycosyl hydrolase domain-containing protein [Acutalibacteraceae bacterium]
MRALSYAEQFGRTGFAASAPATGTTPFPRWASRGAAERVRQLLPDSHACARSSRSSRFGDDEAVAITARWPIRCCALDEHALCGDRYARAFCDDGSAVGVAGSEECEIDLLAQSFAAMTLGRRPETERAMFTAYEKLFDRAHGILRLFTPAFDKTKQKVGYIRSYPPGIRENGGQYTHAAVWGAKAFFAIGRPDIGLQLINAINPAARCADPAAAAVYGAEPYVLSADVYAARGNEGRAGWSWYTGAAAWYYRVILEDALGVRFSDGFRRVTVAPAMEYTLECALPGVNLRIVSAAGAETTLNGRPCVFPVTLEAGENVITVPPVV